MLKGARRSYFTLEQTMLQAFNILIKLNALKLNPCYFKIELLLL